MKPLVEPAAPGADAAWNHAIERRIAITEALVKSGAAPLTGKPGAARTRRMLVKGFPGAAVYLHFETAVVLYAVSHLSRQPENRVERLEGKRQSGSGTYLSIKFASAVKLGA